ncbi:hypothetical protein M9H77_32135 [Catharanthus roseus]|uniref:Uncharacterized protein n=1 Tax=Catharanthus roseus TaxID=4058 RepID=A0ACC0A4H0_CATRO|nr:hypothetical protein M9H77_32135 [Catharanthus roseus]
MGAPLSNSTRKLLLMTSFLLLILANTSGPLLLRFYYVKGGSRIWFVTWLQTGGWPIILIPLFISYFNRRKTDPVNAKLFHVPFPAIISAAVLGTILGVTNFLYAIAAQRLPVSTSTLILASNLIFTAFAAFLLVKQKFTPYSVNAVVLLTAGAAALALHASSDRPEGQSKKSYAIGFAMMFISAALTGLVFPGLELVYKKTKLALTFELVTEIQLLLTFSATVFATIGMIINNDFKVISREAGQFLLGETKYYVVIISIAIIFQLSFLGVVGIIFCASALVNGIITTVLLPITEVLAVIFFHDKFTSEKGMSLALCLWGFISHLYGEYRASKKQNQIIMQESAIYTPNIAPAVELQP